MNAFAGEASTLTVRVSPGWKTVPPFGDVIVSLGWALPQPASEHNKREQPIRNFKRQPDLKYSGTTPSSLCQKFRGLAKMVTGNEVSAVRLSRVPREILACGNSKPVTTFAELAYRWLRLQT